MPLDESMRVSVTGYVLKHVVPKGVRPRPRKAMEWFVDQFSFVVDEPLRKHLAESMYQARFVGRIHEALGLRGDFNRAFVKQQIFLHASIYEAVIDYYLELNRSDPACSGLFSVAELRRAADVLGKNAALTCRDAEGSYQVVPAREVSRPRKLQANRFADRLTAAKNIGLVPKAQADFIQSLYDARNNIHIKRAAEQQFAPDAKMSSQAFHDLRTFLRHAKRWVATQ